MKQEYAAIVHEALKESGINFVAYLPDDQIHDAQKLITEDKAITTIGVTNEAEAVATCAGAWLGGAKPALLIACFHALQCVIIVASIPLPTRDTGEKCLAG